jgi:hypothetical protein
MLLDTVPDVFEVAYAAGHVVSTRLWAGHFAWKTSKRWLQTRPDTGDWIFATLGAAALSVVWPVYFTAPLWKKANARLPVIGAEKAVREERAAIEKQQREHEISRLERELLDR